MATNSHALILAGMVGAFAAASCSNGTLTSLPNAPSSVSTVVSTEPLVANGTPLKISGSAGDRGRSATNRVQLSGFVEARGLAARTLIVRGTLATVPETALIRHGSRTLTLADIGVGDKVQIKGTVTGTLVVATEVKVEERHHDDGESADDGEVDEDTEDETDSESTAVRLRGVVEIIEGDCPEVTFALAGAWVRTDSATRFKGVACIELHDGANVAIRGARQDDGSIAAARIELAD